MPTEPAHPVGDVLLVGEAGALIRIAAKRMGCKPEEIATAEVNLKIEQVETSNMIAKGLEVSGIAAGVQAALDALNSER